MNNVVYCLKSELNNIFITLCRNPELAYGIFDSIPAGISITTDKTCREIRHNKKAAEFLRIQPWESLSLSASRDVSFKVYSGGKEISPEEMPIQRAIWWGEEVNDMEIEFVWNDGVHKTAVINSNPLIDDNGAIIGAFASFADITEQKLTKKNLSHKNKVIEGINRILLHSLTCKTEEELDQICLNASQELTGSQFGFIGEINSAGYMINIAISPSGWTNCQMQAPNSGGRIHRRATLHGLYGRVLLDGKSLFTNNPSFHPDSIGIPKGHPPVNAFLGTPLIHNGKTIGMIGLANREGGYREENVETIEALAHTVVQVILRKRAEEKLHESEERYSALAEKFRKVDLRLSEERFYKAFHSSPGVMSIQNSDGCFIEINEKFMEVFGFSRDEVIGRNSLELNIYIDPAQRVEIFKIIYGSGRVKDFEIKFRVKNGKILTLLTSAEIIQLNNEQVILYHQSDITERKQAEEELQKPRQEKVDILERITDNFIAFDKNWRCAYINKAAELYFIEAGIDAKELLGRVFWKIHPETVGTIFYCEYHRAMAEQKSVTFEARCTLSGKWLEVSAYPSPDGLSVYFRNMEERKRIQDSLHEKEEQLRQITDNMMDVVMKIDKEGIVRYVSPSYTNLMGYPCEYRLGRSCLENMHPDDAERIISGFESVVRAEKREGTLEFRYRIIDGRYLWLEASVKALFDDGGEFEGAVIGVRDITRRKQAEERFFKAFNSHPAFMNIRTLDGKCIDINNTFLANTGYSKEEIIGTTYEAHHIYGSSGPPPELIRSIHENKPVNNLEIKFYTKQCKQHTGLLSTEFIELNGETCVLIIMNDITELKHFEKEMSRLDRLNLVGQMAGGIAHEIRNPMTTVRGYLQFLGEKKELRKYADRFQIMISELDRANSIITEYLTLARSRISDAKTKNLNSIVKDLIYLIETYAIKDDKYVNIELEDVPNLLLEENDIRQLILNMIRNGLEAMDPGGYLTIKTFADGEEVVLAISDQGRGIPLEHMDKMGIPFFTTKAYGTGLGLAVCYKIAARHFAAIDIETSQAGTTFYIRFKVPESRNAATETVPTAL